MKNSMFLNLVTCVKWTVSLNYTICINLHKENQTIFFFFLQYWGLNSGPTSLSTPPALFCEGFSQDRVWQNYLPELALN
jgi:hypothetical protein